MARDSITKTAEYPHPPERIWVALTDARALAEWLMPNTFTVAEPGTAFEFRYDTMPLCGTGRTRCEVLEADEPRRMVWSWRIENHPGKRQPPAMTVEWTLEPIEVDGRPGTRLTLVQRGLRGQLPLHGFMMSMGWVRFLKKMIPRVLPNIDDAGAFTPGAIPMSKRCYKANTIPDEFVR